MRRAKRSSTDTDYTFKSGFNLRSRGGNRPERSNTGLTLGHWLYVVTSTVKNKLQFLRRAGGEEEERRILNKTTER